MATVSTKFHDLCFPSIADHHCIMTPLSAVLAANLLDGWGPVGTRPSRGCGGSGRERAQEYRLRGQRHGDDAGLWRAVGRIFRSTRKREILRSQLRAVSDLFKRPTAIILPCGQSIDLNSHQDGCRQRWRIERIVLGKCDVFPVISKDS